MSIIKKKVFMLGTFAVGKTSLIRRFVQGIFSDKYLTTIGVKIDKKSVIVKNQKVDLVLWDINGIDTFQKVQPSYFRGASGYLLVVDLTRKETLDEALHLQIDVEKIIGNIPYIMVFNKSDLDECEIDNNTLDNLAKDGLSVVKTSAKTGKGVEDVFIALTNKMLNG